MMIYNSETLKIIKAMAVRNAKFYDEFDFLIFIYLIIYLFVQIVKGYQIA